MLTKFSYYYKQNKYASSYSAYDAEIKRVRCLVKNILLFPSSYKQQPLLPHFSPNKLKKHVIQHKIILLSISSQTEASISLSFTYATE